MSITRRPAPAAIDGGPARPTGSPRTRRWRRLARGALVIAAGTAALALAGPFALRPFVDAAGAAGEVTVAFVLDFGPGGSQVVGCVSVPATDSRYDALSAFATEKGLVPPAYAPSGLLCSIDLIPASGCGQSVAGGYIYWSYFTGSGGRWAYSSTGAFATVRKGDVEGWRFQDPGSGRPNDPGPRTAAVFTSICSGGTPHHHHDDDDVDDGAPCDRRWVVGHRRLRPRRLSRRLQATVAPMPAAARWPGSGHDSTSEPRDHHHDHDGVDRFGRHVDDFPRLHRTDGPAGGPRHRPGSLGRAGHRVRPADHRRAR